MPFRLRLYIAAFCLLIPLAAHPQELSQKARFSLITCAPGQEVYARFGHTALQVEDEENDIDIIFNYGIFDFDTDHFYWKFVKGDTWYELGATPTWWFLRQYGEEQREVFRQTLNLTPEEKEKLWQALVMNYQPENRKYLYNFVFDNCATRPYVLISNTLGQPLYSSYEGWTGQTYRAFLRHYADRWSWFNAGINLLFGPEADKTMDSQQRLFLPEELMLFMQQARRPDGEPFVTDAAIKPFELKPTPWYASWPFGLGIYFLTVLAVSIRDRKRNRWSWGLELAAAVPYAMLLMIVTFLTFFSCHPLVGFGWRLLIIPFTHLCARLVYILR